jgi:MoaA/NifB/PqqE/SkfB family radical SAM enzyme
MRNFYHTAASVALRLARKDLWMHREKFMKIADRLYETNPEFADSVARKYTVSLPRMLWRRRKFRRKNGFKPPLAVILNPGDYCQLNCEGCITGAERQGKRSVLSLETMESVAQQLHGFGSRSVTIMGGEPFHTASRDNVYALMRRFSKHIFSIFTNGIGLTREVADVAAENCNSIFLLSCNGVGEMSDRTRGAGSFRGVENAIGYLNRNNVPYSVSATVMEYNLEHLCSEDFIRYFEDRGAIGILYVLFMPLDGEYKGRMPTREQVERFRARLAEQQTRSRMLLQSYTNLTNTSACRAGTHHFYVNADGEVSPCFAISYSMGNVHEQRLEDILTSPFAHDFRQMREEMPKKCAAIADPQRIIKTAEQHGLRPTCATMANYARIQPELFTEGYLS